MSAYQLRVVKQLLVRNISPSPPPPPFMTQQPLVQGRRTNGTRDQNGTRKDFLGTRHSLLTLFFYFFCSTSVSIFWRIYIYIYMCVCVCVCVCVAAYRLCMNYRCYQMTVQWNIFTQIGAERNVDWIFIIWAPVWRWLGEYVTLGWAFYGLFL